MDIEERDLGNEFDVRAAHKRTRGAGRPIVTSRWTAAKSIDRRPTRVGLLAPNDSRLVRVSHDGRLECSPRRSVSVLRTTVVVAPTCHACQLVRAARARAVVSVSSSRTGGSSPR